MIDGAFPIIRTLDDIRPALETEGFKLYDKTDEGYYVVNYEKGVYEFPTPLHRECRGLIFDTEGKLIARRFHKFFNMGEYPETSFENLLEKMKTVGYVTEEKLDGSMVSPVKVGDKIYWMSKMGITDTSMLVANYVAQHPEFESFARYWIEGNHTPIFEYVGPHNRIVIDYPEDLYLLAIRDNETGEYIDPRDCEYGGEYDNNPWDFCVPMDYSAPISVLIEDLKTDNENEGIVIAFKDGHKVKIKTEWYVKLHKAKDLLSSEYHTLKCLWDGQMDDFIPLLPEEDVIRVKKLLSDTLEDITNTAKFLRNKFDLYSQQSEGTNFKGAKKDFALAVLADKEITGPQRRILFQYFERKILVMQQGVEDVASELIARCSTHAYSQLKELLKYE